MLDRKKQNWEASIELIEDRKQFCFYSFIVFYPVGGFMIMFSILLPMANLAEYVAYLVGAGLFLLVLATWFLIIYHHHQLCLFMIHKNMFKTREPKGKK